MTFFKGTASALMLSLCLGAGGAMVAPDFTVPAAYAQADAESRLRSALEMQGIPAGIINWSSVEEAGTGLVAHGVYANLSSFKLGFDTIPLGDLELTDLQTDGTHVTKFKGRFAGISVNLAELMATGQKIGQAAQASGAPGNAASMGMVLTMAAGYVMGLGYQSLDVTLDFDNEVDLSAETMTTSGSFDIKDAFKIDVGVDMIGISVAYLDWAKANATKMFIDRSPEAIAAMQAAMKDPDSPLSKVGFTRYAFAFDDQGLMPKLESQLIGIRAKMLGTNPDGTPKTEMTDDDIKKAAQDMSGGSGLSADKLEPVVRALYTFVMHPDVISLAVNADPAITYGELTAFSQPTAPDAPKTDWNSRLSFEAAN